MGSAIKAARKQRAAQCEDPAPLKVLIVEDSDSPSLRPVSKLLFGFVVFSTY